MSAKPHTRFRHLLALLLLACATFAAAEGDRIELIELKGRSAEELIPLLQPVVAPNGALSGSGYRLIVRATPAQLAELHRLLAELDHPPRRLLLTVHMGQLSQRARQGVDANVQLQGDGGGVRLGEPAGDGRGLAIEGQSGEDSAGIRLHSTRTLSDGAQRQQVQALEGEPAYIATGSERPYPAQVEVWRGPLGGRGGAVSTEYKEAASGFYAVARLRGDQVVVRISPQRQAFDAGDQGIVETQRIVTTVSGPLGSWLPLGGSGDVTVTRRDDTGRTLTTRTLDARPMWLKVELAP